MPESPVQELEKLPPDAAIAADHRNPRRRNRHRQREEEAEVGLLGDCRTLNSSEESVKSNNERPICFRGPGDPDVVAA